ncbi:MAG: hypothetical protein LBR88_11320 [Zoogloeaceae bacterium]|jgi:hypothetical protein|nr:hypothetical protein [Zoogloeaceae bacterium]
MGYFKLETPVEVTPYPFDFHSHFNGILPLENKVKWKGDGLTVGGITIGKEDDLSILGLLGGKSDNNESIKSAHYKLFNMVLKFFIRHLVDEKSIFSISGMNDYQRGECAAENLYIACSILQHVSGNAICHDVNHDMDKPCVYLKTHKLLENDLLKSDTAYHVVAYFNKKLFAANKYTPFDDAYWVRGSVIDNKDYTDKFNLMSLCYMYASGVRYAQIAVSKNSVKKIDSLIQGLQREYKYTGYKLLAQSPAVYSNKEKFEGELNSILELFKSSVDKPKNLVGIDLLSTENKTGLYKEFFDFLSKEDTLSVFNNHVGPSEKPSKKAIMHIHCGEGGGNSENNRSLCGYYLCNAVHPDMREFSSALADYTIKYYRKNVARTKERKRERDHLKKKDRDYLEVTTLFDELFQWNNLVIDGLQLHRFDINSLVSRALVAYNGKTNIIHFCDTLEIDDDKRYYDKLCKGKTPFSFRIGHAYYNRNYLSARFPALYYDTNLGSNFITGASGIFDSTQLYKLNSGLRKLDGHIDTNLIEEVLDSVAHIGRDRLNAKQRLEIVKLMSENTVTPDTLSSIIGNIDAESIKASIKDFLGRCLSEPLKNKDMPHEMKFQILCSILSVALNWCSYLLGADGQGVEHSDTQAEAVRMTFMLAYGMCDGLELISAEWFNNIAELILNVSCAYWKETIGTGNMISPEQSVYKVDRFQGFKARNSVVLVKASRIKKE